MTPAWKVRFDNGESPLVAAVELSYLFLITATLGISEENCNRLIRTFQAFLEGFCLLANNDAFGHALPVEVSFNFSLRVLNTGMKELEGK